MDYSNFKDQVIVISAAGGDIGGGCAVAFAKLGAKLALNDICADRLAAIVQKVKDAGADDTKVFGHVGDMTKQAAVTEFVEGTIQMFNKINVLINMVGTKRPGGVANTSLEQFTWVVDGNLYPMFMLSKACMPHIIQSKGNILNMSSVSGMRPAWLGAAYSTVKAATDNFTRCLGVELAPQGARCNAISPAAIDSAFNVNSGFLSESDSRWYFKNAKNAIPMGRVGTVEDCVNLMLFMTSDKCDFMNGAIIPLDGGYSCTVSYPPRDF